MKYANIITVARHGEVVELVYGTSLENWRAFVAYRGFESHPLRQKRKLDIDIKYLTFLNIMEEPGMELHYDIQSVNTAPSSDDF